MEYIDYNNTHDMHPAFEYTAVKHYQNYLTLSLQEKDEVLQHVVLEYAEAEGISSTPETMESFMHFLLLDVITALEYFTELEEYEICKMFADLFDVLKQKQKQL